MSHIDESSQPGDAELVRAIMAGDQGAFEILHRRYSRELYRFACSYVHDSTMATDIVQDVFMHFWRRRDSLRSEDALRAFLFQSTRNAALKTLRDSRRRAWAEHEPESGETARADTDLAPDASLEMEEERRRLIRAIKQLPIRAREAIILRWAHGLTYGEIARAMGVSTETVKSQFARSLLLLRKKF